ncbi:kinase-like domain-containing protein [Apodospora peruviana]|uniref:Kinase-like domain-containing protein n=1 Tax=Apodospora peruviana TaxID=516989 RepID=A0AAE0HVL5_9PEZI|nr:kinase-like domain-containing protein [Apodospora peruviana]
MSQLSPVLSMVSPQESFGEFRDNGLRLDGPPSGLENVYDYEPGGHHPVHIGDVLNGQYRVVDKLGVGGHANVWLCRDVLQESTQYFAIKIIMADASFHECHELRVYRLLHLGLAKTDAAELLCLPVGRFDIHGPNGCHFAIVYPVLGPSISRLAPILKWEDSGKALRGRCSQAVKAMATLHSYGICHGDFRPANLLTRTKGLAGLSEERLAQAFGSSRTTKLVQVAAGQPWPASAPRYLVRSVNWDSQVSGDADFGFIDVGVCVADFGESFDANDLPEDLSIPQEYRAPEYILDKRLGIESDIWALGCTLFEIRTGRRLFDTVDDDPDEHLARIVKMLGKFPEPWWSTTWEARRQYFDDETNIDGRPVSLDWWSGDVEQAGQKPARVPHSIEDALTRTTLHDAHHTMSRDEVLLFSDLLRRVFRYTPEKRISVEDILEHAWFRI